jgi:hypothetical protein
MTQKRIVKGSKSPLNCELFLNSATDYSIVDGHGKPVDLARAKMLWECGAVDNYNMAFQRLAQMGFDIPQLKAHYESLRAR